MRTLREIFQADLASPQLHLPPPAHNPHPNCPLSSPTPQTEVHKALPTSFYWEVSDNQSINQDSNSRDGMGWEPVALCMSLLPTPLSSPIDEHIHQWIRNDEKRTQEKSSFTLPYYPIPLPSPTLPPFKTFFPRTLIDQRKCHNTTS